MKKNPTNTNIIINLKQFIMKKLALALVCLVSVAFFASCDPTTDQPEPSITVLNGTGFVTGTVENPQIISMEDDTDWKFGFLVESNAVTKVALAKLEVSYEYVMDGETSYYYDTIDLTGQTKYEYIDKVFNDAKDGVIVLQNTVKATVTDANGEKNSASLAYKIKQDEVELTEKAITWVRRGSNTIDPTNAEMAQAGLQWLARDAYHANIRPISDCDLYVITNNADIYNNIKTDVDLDIYVKHLAETTKPVEEYRNITVAIMGDKVYNDVLVTVQKDGTQHIILFEKANVQKGNYGVQTIISGGVK